VPQNKPSAIIAWGVAIQLLGVVAAYQYMRNGSGPAALIWVPSGIGCLVTLIGVVIWCRRNITKLRRLAGWLLLLGGLTFCIAALGHALGVFFLVAIPTLILGGGAALLAIAAAEATILFAGCLVYSTGLLQAHLNDCNGSGNKTGRRSFLNPGIYYLFPFGVD
jgi:hypothetical protein